MRALIVALMVACGAVVSLWPADRSAAAQSSGVAVLPAGCFLLDGMGAFVSGIRSGNEITITVRDDGGIEATCRARLAPAADGEPRTWTFANTGQSCTVLVDGELVQTESWEETVSADGIGVLVCRVVAPRVDLGC